MAQISNKILKTKNGNKILIRTAQIEDSKAIFEIQSSISQEEVFMLRDSSEISYNQANSQEKISNYLENENWLYLVAEVDGLVVGFCEISNGYFNKTKHCADFSIFILNNFRSLGIGKILLTSLLEWSMKNPILIKVTLAVFSTNKRAINLYKNLGFTIEGTCPKDMKLPNGEFIDSILMYKFVD
ncbi:MAG: GNAT family N-acetyltransferase [Calditrichaeota bacterium]|nr:MAG: GNAT family N-acetyltransferase [Calditrichota bacterium]